MQTNNHNHSKKVAVAGVLSALSVVLMLVGGVIPIATFMAPILAGLCLIPVAVEVGVKTALLAYLAVSIIAFLLVPDRELVFFFIFLFGYYPLLRPVIHKIPIKALQWVVKLVLFNGAVAVIYAVLLLLFSNPLLQQEFASYSSVYYVFFLVAGNLLFLLYDNLTDKIKIIYLHRVRKNLFR